MATVQVTRETVIELIKRMPDEKLAVLYDFGRYIMRPVTDDVLDQDVSAAGARLAATVVALQARSNGGRMSGRLMNERAEERARG